MRIPLSRLGGIGDEAADTLAGQLAAQQALGFGCIELRSIDRVPIASLASAAVDALVDAVERQSLQVVALDSKIGDWSRPISTPFETDLEDLGRVVALAKRLKARVIRVMSYPNDGRSTSSWEREVTRRLKVLATIAGEGGVTLAIENCAGLAERDPQCLLGLIDAAPGLRCLFDTGNPVHYGYNGLDYLRAVASFVAHVHVKDATAPNGKVEYTLPGKGSASVLECIDFLLAHGYAGAFSLEPHLALIPHLGVRSDPDRLASSYQEYGLAFLELLDDVD